MEFHPASIGSVSAFVLVVSAVTAAFLAAVRWAYRADEIDGARVFRRALLSTAAWLGFLSGVVTSGLLPRLPLAGLPFFFGSILLVSAAVGFSPLGRQLSLSIPLSALVAFQAFRLPLELILHRWVAEGTIPVSMTWNGQNWDVLSGVVALAAAPLATRHRGAAWFANVVGSLLLLNVIRVAVLSSPLPFGWGIQPPLVLALHFPYLLIGPVCVGGALSGHIVLTRALLRPR